MKGCPFVIQFGSNIPLRLKLGITLGVALMVMSSPIVMLINPALTAAMSSPLSSYGNPLAPSTIGQDGDFTTQAAISSLTARPTNNIVNTNSFYDIVFLTTTSGAIKTIEVTFPAGTTIPAGAYFNTAEKCVPGTDCTEMTGTVSKSGQTITYTITNAVNVPGGTKIVLEFANINNPLNPSSSYQVTVTTRDSSNVIIDGPSQSAMYTVKQIGSAQIADNAITTAKIADEAITSTKPAESYQKRVFVTDTPAGHEVGWNPNGVTEFFTITDPAVSSVTTAFVSFSIGATAVTNCEGANPGVGQFTFSCETPPSEGAELQYMVTNLPANVIS
jgi:hypothetical protein